MLLWVVIVGGVFSFILAWALGANDVANAFGTSVGSKALSLRQALVVAAVVEFSGAVLMGSHVVDSLRNKIIKPNLYEAQPEELMVGMLSALIAAASWLVLATFLKLPVSTTHGMVGAIVGFALVAKDTDSVDWWEIGKICISWVTSPVLAGILSFSMFFLVRFSILRRENSLTLGYRFLPFFYAFTLGALTFFVIYKGSPGLGLNDLPFWLIAVIVGGVALAALVFSLVVVVPYLRYRISKMFDENGIRKVNKQSIISDPSDNAELGEIIDAQGNQPPPFMAFFHRQSSRLQELAAKVFPNRNNHEDGDQISDSLTIKPTVLSESTSDTKEEMYAQSEEFDERTEELFSFLQVLTACVGGFAHGSNDVSNAIAPLVVIISIYVNESVEQNDTPWWVLLMGGAAIVLGLAMWGYRVMSTIGHDMTKLTSSRGFNIGTRFYIVL